MDTAAPEARIDVPAAPVREPSAADRVYAHVRAGVLNRRFADNDLLSEGRIADETGVSRTPVREALLRLEAEGMMRLLPKRGALVLAGVDAGVARRAVHPAAGREPLRHCRHRLPAAATAVAAVLDRAPGPAARGRGGRRRTRPTWPPTATSTPPSSPPPATPSSPGCTARLRDRQIRMGATNLMSADGAPTPGGWTPPSPIIARSPRRSATTTCTGRLTLTREHLATAERTLRES